MNDGGFWLMLAIVFVLVMSFRIFVVGDIPEGYEDENGFHYGKKEKNEN